MTKIKISEMFNLDRMGLTEYPKLALRLKGILEKAKISKVYYDYKIEDETYFDDLTLIIRPRFQRGNSEYNMSSQSSSSPAGKLLSRISKLRGWEGTDRMRSYSGDDRKKILINVGTMMSKAEVEIGCYIEDRNALVLYYDIMSTNRSYQTDCEVLFFFVKYLVDYMKKEKVKKKNLKAIIEKKTMEQFSVAIKSEITNKENENKGFKNNIDEYEKYIIDHIKKMAINDTEIESVKKMLANVKGYVQKQITEIKRLDFVKSVDLSAEGLKVNIGDIFIRHRGDNVYIGDFSIIIKPKRIRIENNDPLKRDGTFYAHPHISSDGTVCYGSRKNDIIKLLAQNEFKKLVHILHLYLKSYNEGDSYNNIRYWVTRQTKMQGKRTSNGSDLTLSSATAENYDEEDDDDD